ncbi:hypothetical protein [Nocardia sp. NPDC052112]|uniref:hypothetical protein n=1 Tax=Nocardia sp. NPDC052112 TaxID=3155646 RepID=UPI003414E32D
MTGSAVKINPTPDRVEVGLHEYRHGRDIAAGGEDLVDGFLESGPVAHPGPS